MIGDDAFVARIDPAALATPRAERAGPAAPAWAGALAGAAAAAAPAGAAALDRVLILVDTSASRAPVMGRQVALVRDLAAALPPDAALAIAAFDHTVDEVYRGRAGDAAAAVNALYEHGALGASDLGAALSLAAASGMARVVLVGDGVPTLGEHDPARLAAIVHGSPLARIDAIQIGQSLDRDTLAAIVAAGRAPGAILDGRDPAHVAHQLASALPPEEPLRVDGAASSFPSTTRGQPPGEPIWVAGRRTGAGPLTVRIGARTIELPPRRASPARVQRAVAKAELAALTEQLHQATQPADRTSLGARIEALALAHHLVSARTSLLVLESDADELRMLTPAERGEPAPPAPTPAVGVTSPALAPRSGGTADRSSAPIIDQGSTQSSVTITEDYLRSIPTGSTFGRTFKGEDYAELIVISGRAATSLENTYVVEGVAAGAASRELGLSPLALAVAVDRLRSTAAPFGLPPRHHAPAPDPPPMSPYTGELQAIMSALANHDRDTALSRSLRWQLTTPGDVAALLALGESLEARGAHTLVARAYASLIDLFPSRVELLRTAAERLDRVASTAPAARPLAIDAYRRALRERPDHITTYRLLAYALLQDGRGDEAIDILGAALARTTRPSITEILAGDAGLIAAHLIARDPRKRATLVHRMRRGIPDRPSLRVILSWETDANDVDLHIRDGAGHHAFFSQPHLPSGGALLEDLTDGYGPEMFLVDNPLAFPYRASVHYYRRGPMGLGLGTLQIIRHDGAGNITLEHRPFAIQNDGATIDLGSIPASTPQLQP